MVIVTIVRERGHAFPGVPRIRISTPVPKRRHARPVFCDCCDTTAVPSYPVCQRLNPAISEPAWTRSRSSSFTSLTGAVSDLSLLLLVRFCSGMGKAGAYPNASIVTARWIPAAKRAWRERGGVNGEPGQRSDLPAAGSADSGPLRMAGIVLLLRIPGVDLGSGVVLADRCIAGAAPHDWAGGPGSCRELKN